MGRSLSSTRSALGAVALLLAGCAPPRAPEPPAPTAPPPSTDVGVSRRDSARALPRIDRADSARGSARTTAARVARPSARTDTLAVRALRAPVRVCAGGDVTLGTNLDLGWARP